MPLGRFRCCATLRCDFLLLFFCCLVVTTVFSALLLLAVVASSWCPVITAIIPLIFRNVDKLFDYLRCVVVVALYLWSCDPTATAADGGDGGGGAGAAFVNIARRP